MRKICSEILCNCWRTLFWSINYPPFSCRSRGVQGAWSGEENTPSTIPLTAKLAFYEHVEIPGRSPSSVRGQLYALFPQGLSVRAIRQEMGVHLEFWCLEADSTDAMVGVEQPVHPWSRARRGRARAAASTFRGSASRQTRQPVHLMGNGLPIRRQKLQWGHRPVPPGREPAN